MENQTISICGNSMTSIFLKATTKLFPNNFELYSKPFTGYLFLYTIFFYKTLKTPIFCLVHFGMP